mmetsp:Transcript_6343/g.13856  ORF Transcript_6343/g.13856 Transcript_6343/m.13856 type:complete len:229 (-) Transcript_6343:668-1354(-)
MDISLLVLAFLFVNLPPHLNMAVSFSDMLGHPHATLLVIHLFQLLILCKLLEELLADAVLLLQLCSLLLFALLHLPLICLLHVFTVARPPIFLCLFAASVGSLNLLGVEVISQLLQLLLFFRLGFHLAQDVANNVLSLLGLLHLPLGLSILAGDLVAEELSHPVVLLPLLLCHGGLPFSLLAGALQHGLLRILRLLRSCSSIQCILMSQPRHKLLHVVSLLLIVRERF